jgi:hypothetical protein
MKNTVGKISLELANNLSDNTHSAHDQMRENLTEYDKNIYECIERSKKDFMFDFYVIVITKKEKLMQNVLRHYFLSRNSCPTPQYDEAVYKFHRKDEKLDFLWVVPSKETCDYFVANALNIPDEERELLNFVLQFTNGDLDARAKKLNNEKDGLIVTD